jgi:hypothetical protein
VVQHKAHTQHVAHLVSVDTTCLEFFMTMATKQLFQEIMPALTDKI